MKEANVAFPGMSRVPNEGTSIRGRLCWVPGMCPARREDEGRVPGGWDGGPSLTEVTAGSMRPSTLPQLSAFIPSLTKPYFVRSRI